MAGREEAIGSLEPFTDAYSPRGFFARLDAISLRSVLWDPPNEPKHSPLNLRIEVWCRGSMVLSSPVAYGTRNPTWAVRQPDLSALPASVHWPSNCSSLPLADRLRRGHHHPGVTLRVLVYHCPTTPNTAVGASRKRNSDGSGGADDGSADVLINEIVMTELSRVDHRCAMGQCNQMK
jgi:hypothetical protein